MPAIPLAQTMNTEWSERLARTTHGWQRCSQAGRCQQCSSGAAPAEISGRGRSVVVLESKEKEAKKLLNSEARMAAAIQMTVAESSHGERGNLKEAVRPRAMRIPCRSSLCSSFSGGIWCYIPIR